MRKLILEAGSTGEGLGFGDLSRCDRFGLVRRVDEQLDFLDEEEHGAAVVGDEQAVQVAVAPRRVGRRLERGGGGLVQVDVGGEAEGSDGGAYCVAAACSCAGWSGGCGDVDIVRGAAQGAASCSGDG